jgi:hypothetical protein
MKQFPATFRSLARRGKIETWVLKSVVAPQSRSKVTALRLPSGETTVLIV